MRMAETKLTAVLKKENEEWSIQLKATSVLAKKLLGKMIKENRSPHRENAIVLVLWQREALYHTSDEGFDEIEFAISEGPDSSEFDEARAGLALLNLEGLFIRRR